MRERPILFSAPMVRALLAGTKMQTRRVVKPYHGHELVNLREAEGDERYSGRFNDPESWGYQFLDDGAPASLAMWPELSPYGHPGDRLWVRETFSIGEDLGAEWESWMSEGDRFVIYESDFATRYCVPDSYRVPRNAREAHNQKGTDEHWRSFGPIPSIHMPRWASRILLEITEVRVERLQDINATAEGVDEWARGVCGDDWPTFTDPRRAYAGLWNSINGPGSWDANPWVWVIAFRPAAQGGRSDG